MRRRRRHSTQLFRTDTAHHPYIQASRTNKKGPGRYLVYLILLCAAVLIAYYAYQNYYHPAAMQISAIPAENKTSDLPAGNASLSTPAAEPAPPVQKKIQVEILNGCGKEGIAKIFQSYLQEQGYDVMNAENYTENGKRRWDVPASMVIARTGNTKAADELARLLGIAGKKVTSKPDPNALYDISVVLGRDYIVLKAMTDKNR